MAEPESRLRIFILGDDPLARAGIAASLASHAGAWVVGEASASEAGIEEAQQASPEVIVWDLGLEPSAALERLEGRLGLLPPILALIPQEDSAAEAWLAGVRALLLREVDGPRLLAAAAAAAKGLVVLDVPPAALSSIAPHPGGAEEALTPRESEVLGLLAEGLPNKSIAARLGITEHTAKFHVNAILRKLGAQSRTEAVVLATRRGLLLL
jgi:DNA-binding NarL/FixJ family response regulator